MKEWLDGPGLCAWLEQRGIVLNTRHARWWRRGRSIRIWDADRALTRVGVHLDELPDWLWREHEGDCERDMAEIEAATIASLRDGQYPGPVAKRWGLTTELVELWGRQAGIFIIRADGYRDRESRRVAA